MMDKAADLWPCTVTLGGVSDVTSDVISYVIRNVFADVFMPDSMTSTPRTIARPDETARAAALARLDQLVKPPGSLGRLEGLVGQLAALQGSAQIAVKPASYVLFAADHGVTVHGVSPYPQSVTRLMVQQIAEGRAASSVLARRHGMRLEVVDVGVAGDCPFPGVVIDKTVSGTGDFCSAPAMGARDCVHAMEAGARAIDRVLSTGGRIVVLGEMGIGNTTAASAVLAAIARDQPVTALVGSGTGLDADGIRHKCSVITKALARHGLTREGDAPVCGKAVLQAVGGLELVALAGAMLTAAENRLPVLVDGFIATVAARVAILMDDAVTPYLIATHRSPEPGHAVALSGLSSAPLLDLNMRLGEGTGAGIAYGLVADAVDLYANMATLQDAGITAGV